MLPDCDSWEYKIKIKGLDGILRVFIEDMTIFGLQQLNKEGKNISYKAELFYILPSLVRSEALHSL
jgi:hypothetical protein